MYNEDKIKANIGKIRQEKNLSQEYVASVLNISRNTYRNLECGNTSIIHPTIYKLAYIFNMPIENLLFETNQNNLNDPEQSYDNEKITNLQNQLSQCKEIIQKQQNTIKSLQKYNEILTNSINDKNQIINFLQKDTKK